MTNVEEIIKDRLENNTEYSILERVDEQILEYVEDDWSDNYETEYEWYIDHCNGEAESDIIREVINDNSLSTDDYCEIYDALKETWGL